MCKVLSTARISPREKDLDNFSFRGNNLGNEKRRNDASDPDKGVQQ